MTFLSTQLWPLANRIRRWRLRARQPRRGVTVMTAALLMIGLLGVTAFSVDVGYIVLVRTELQASADAAAMAGATRMGGGKQDVINEARRFAENNIAGGRAVQLNDSDVEFGIWDSTTRVFTPTGDIGNAIRVTAYRDEEHGGAAALFFGRIFGLQSFEPQASAVAMANPRDIAFVVDLSGSMNDDTEDAWATGAINSEFKNDGFPIIGNELMESVYQDFGYGPFPGQLQYVGQPVGLKQDKWAYAELTSNVGPLASNTIPSRYRIFSSDNEKTRKRKAYRWMIDKQIVVVMPKALPAPNSTTNYAYWEKYLDYIMQSVSIRAPKPKPKPNSNPKPIPNPKPKPPPAPKPPNIGQLPNSLEAQFALLRGAEPWAAEVHRRATPDTTHWSAGIFASLALGAARGTPPIDRGRLPPSQDGDQITKFNNPNKQTFPSAKSPSGYRNRIGYLTYVQFMMDHGRDLKPAGGIYTPLSIHSPDCPYHTEVTPGGTFSFPPREQPMHATRRALIAAMEVVRERNSNVPDAGQRDWVSIVTFDRLDANSPKLQAALTSKYRNTMQACTELQATGDKGASTATESGLRYAREQIAPASEGGQGRENANKVVVLLTDGVPNVYETSTEDINDFINDNPSSDFYGSGYYWYDAPLMQAAQMQADKWQVYSVGLGLGTDYEFMDRLGRFGGTANDNGESPRGTGNPAEYEQRLTDIFEEIIKNPQVRLVK